MGGRSDFRTYHWPNMTTPLTVGPPQRTVAGTPVPFFGPRNATFIEILPFRSNHQGELYGTLHGQRTGYHIIDLFPISRAHTARPTPIFNSLAVMVDQVPWRDAPRDTQAQLRPKPGSNRSRSSGWDNVPNQGAEIRAIVKYPTVSPTIRSRLTVALNLILAAPEMTKFVLHRYPQLLQVLG